MLSLLHSTALISVDSQQLGHFCLKSSVQIKKIISRWVLVFAIPQQNKSDQLLLPFSCLNEHNHHEVMIFSWFSGKKQCCLFWLHLLRMKWGDEDRICEIKMNHLNAADKEILILIKPKELLMSYTESFRHFFPFMSFSQYMPTCVKSNNHDKCVVVVSVVVVVVSYSSGFCGSLLYTLFLPPCSLSKIWLYDEICEQSVFFILFSPHCHVKHRDKLSWAE